MGSPALENTGPSAKHVTLRHKSWRLRLLPLLFLSVTLGLIVTPELLIQLDPLKGRFTSENELLRNTVYMEIFLFRILCFAVAILLSVALIAWNNLRQLSYVKKISSEAYYKSPPDHERTKLLNRPFLIIMFCVAIWMLYPILDARMFSGTQFRMINGVLGANKGRGIDIATGILFAVSSVWSLLLAVRVAPDKSRKAFHLVLGSGFLLISWEELSLGRAVIDLVGNDTISDLYVAVEYKLANRLGYLPDHLRVMGAFVYGCILPLLASRSRYFRQVFSFVGVPLASKGLAVGFLVISLIHPWTVGIFLSTIIGEALIWDDVRDWRDLFASLAFLLLMHESWILSRAAKIPPKQM